MHVCMCCCVYVIIAFHLSVSITFDVRVCVGVLVWVCVHARMECASSTGLNMYFLSVFFHVCEHFWIYKCVYIFLYIYIEHSVLVYVNIFSLVYQCMLICAHACVCVCVSVCVCVYMSAKVTEWVAVCLAHSERHHGNGTSSAVWSGGRACGAQRDGERLFSHEYMIGQMGWWYHIFNWGFNVCLLMTCVCVFNLLTLFTEQTNCNLLLHVWIRLCI